MLAEDSGAEVPAAATLVIERNVLEGGTGPDVVLIGPGSSTPWLGHPSGTACL